MAAIASVEALLDVALLLTHPSQYIAAVTVVENILVDPYLNRRAENLHLWPSHVWQGITVLINRLTPAHKDAQGDPAAFDLLLSAGTATTPELKLPGLGATFSYLPGTVFLILGKLITHQVDAWGSGDRICYAHWLRHRSVKESSVGAIKWCTLNDICTHWLTLVGAANE
jgi:hypothetical protein